MGQQSDNGAYLDTSSSSTSGAATSFDPDVIAMATVVGVLDSRMLLDGRQMQIKWQSQGSSFLQAGTSLLPCVSLLPLYQPLRNDIIGLHFQKPFEPP